MTTIVTLGGGGFSMPLDDGRPSAIDAHLLELTGVECPRVCFVPTASGDSRDYIARFHAAFDEVAETSVLTLFGSPEYVPASHLLDQHLVYVGGGSTLNLLALWRLHGVDEALREAGRRGTILAGISAGMNCWYEASSTDSWGELAPLHDGLGWLPGAACPHLHGEPGRRDLVREWVASSDLPDTWAADDHTALVWHDGVLVEAIGEAPGHPAFHVEQTPDGVRETELAVRQL